MRYYCTVVLVLLLLHFVFGSSYYRLKGNPINNIEINHDRSNVKTLQVGIIEVFEDDILDHIHWILNGILYHIERPIRISYISNLKSWSHKNSIIITYSPLNWYFNWLEENSIDLNLSVIHLGDEGCDQDYSFYSKANFVWRNYYCIEALRNHTNSYYLPLGWITPPDTFATRNPILPVSRYYDFSFVGLMSSDRLVIKNLLDTFDILGNYPNNFVLQPKSQNQEKYFYLGRPFYNGYLGHSKIGLVPGNHSTPLGNETARFYEVVASGAVPLACKCHYFV